ncbi:MAG: DNA gyrase subunit A [Calditrichaeota bacterium]|nr:MAG: DNA gyrase subunit A [Calditrichota bacterium]MBL1205451.1 DNA gyrase subunit A [Calditrichota bacterium]NOG45280.1 DNA gyrase subunit A [Calditrichota bacterium]
MAENENILPRLIEEEMKESYLDYSMSVIVSRALPDVRDGLKPVHRRVLFGMRELSMSHNRPYKKSARIVGEVLGKYHPHGDTAVYDTIVRMVQDFSLRYPLVDGQGNFGSVDGDSPAAMRYTEVRMDQISDELLTDIDKDTVNFSRNFDDTLDEPTVLPAKIPNLLINGSTGIAVGMATNIPPHNLQEVIEAVKATIDNPEIEILDLMEFVKGPDFPTAGILYGTEEIKRAYTTGRGKARVRARTSTEEMKNGRQRIIVSEIPYQVNKLNLLNKIVELIKEKKIEGISDLRDESDRDGMRIVLELKKDIDPEAILNLLYKHTQMQTTFGIILLALVDGQPKVLNLKEIIDHFIKHRLDVIVRRTQFELDQAERRAHILEGLRIAIDNIDEIIELIKKSKDPIEAREQLMKRFGLSEIQAKAILDMRLQRLTGLERDKIEAEYQELLVLIDSLKEILGSQEKQFVIIKDELDEILSKYADERRTEIIENYEEIAYEDLITEEEMVVTISHGGFIKRFATQEYKTQHRGGRGVSGATVKDEDFVEHLFVASTHDYILFFTDRGRCHWLKVYMIPQTSKTARGRSIINLINIEQGEKIQAFVSVRDFEQDGHITMATQNGTIKKTDLEKFSRPRKGGIIAINIREDDKLINAQVTSGNDGILIVTRNGRSIHFKESDVRSMGRNSTGVKAIKLKGDDEVIAMAVADPERMLLTISDHGYGKRTQVTDFRVQNRGGSGIIAMKVTEKTGKLAAAVEVSGNEDIMIITEKGIVIRQKIEQVSIISRNTQGVRMIRLDENDSVSDIALVVNGENESEEVEPTEE